MRKEEAQRELYNKMLDATNNLSSSLSVLSLSINRDATNLKDIFQSLSPNWTVKGPERQNQIDKWYKIVTLMIDAIGKTSLNITNKWINFINFNDMTEIQLNGLIAETKKDLQQIDEFDKCLNDVLVHLYNKYVASPLKLKKSNLKNTQGRRYVSQDGLIDDRPF